LARIEVRAASGIMGEVSFGCATARVEPHGLEPQQA